MIAQALYFHTGAECPGADRYSAELPDTGQKQRPHTLSPLFLGLLCLFLSACAAKHEPDVPLLEQSGTLPVSGSITIRSGLAWMNEDAPLFKSLQPQLEDLLQKRGLRIVAVTPSALEPSPSNPLQQGAVDPDMQRKRISATRSTGVTDEQARATATDLAGQGKLPQVKLRSYALPEDDRDLSPSVMAVKPQDPRTVLFAHSQRSGVPLMRWNGPIPGRMPAEALSGDPAKADYVLIVRFSVVRSPDFAAAVGGRRTALAQQQNTVPDGLRQTGNILVMAAAGARSAPRSVSGVRPMGYGKTAPARPLPSRPGYGNTPGDYIRGYEGTSPDSRDFWNRESDFNSRDYVRRHSPPPEYATPPGVTRQAPPYLAGGLTDPVTGRPVSPTDPGYPPAPGSYPIDQPQTGYGSGASADPASISEGFILEMECWSLVPLRGKAKGKAELVWQAQVRRPADGTPLFQALPGMAELAIGQEKDKAR